MVSDESSIKVMKSPFFTVIIYGSVTFATAFFGYFLVFLLDRSPAALRYIGYIAFAFSLFLLMPLPKYLQKLKKDNGDLIFEAHSGGIKIVPEWLQGTTIWNNSISYVELGWDSIERIVFAEWFVQRTLQRESWHCKMIVFVNNTDDISFTERLYHFNRRSPDGRIVLFTPYSSDHVNTLSLLIEKLSEGRIRPVEYKKVIFDYKNKKVECLQ